MNTRHARRVTTKIRHLAEVFAIVFARNHAEERGSIPARIAFDSLVAGLRSSLGASNRLLTLVGTGRFTHVVSVALLFEYEAACDRIVTFDTRDFVGSERFGIKIETPSAFLRSIGAKS